MATSSASNRAYVVLRPIYTCCAQNAREQLFGIALFRRRYISDDMIHEFLEFWLFSFDNYWRSCQEQYILLVVIRIITMTMSNCTNMFGNTGEYENTRETFVIACARTIFVALDVAAPL